MKLNWYDEGLQWNKSEYGGINVSGTHSISSDGGGMEVMEVVSCIVVDSLVLLFSCFLHQDIRVPPINMWRPDILLYNSANENFDASFPVNIVVQHDGLCNQIPPGIFKSTCKVATLIL